MVTSTLTSPLLNAQNFKILILHGTFLFCWTPYAMLALAGVFGIDDAVPVELTVLILHFAKVCCYTCRF